MKRLRSATARSAYRRYDIPPNHSACPSGGVNVSDAYILMGDAMRFAVLLAALVTGLLLATSATAQAVSPRGNWIVASGNLEVAIAPCGRVMCGTVARVIANRSMRASGSPGAPARVGDKLITNLRRDGDVYRGRIFNRENGRTYDCTVRVGADGRLEVRPYVLLAVFGRSQIWRRA